MELSSALIQSNSSMDFWDFHSHQRGRFALCSCDLLREEVPPIADCPYLSVGLHPWSLPLEVSSPTVEMALEQLNKLAREGRIVAVGEAGWDAHSPAAMDYQQQLVEAQWQIAEENRLPMVLHVVKRWQELEYFIRRSHPTIPLIVHGFRGKAPLAQRLLQLGVWLSFGRYYNRESLYEAWKAGRLLLETDDSSLSIEAIYRAVAEDLGIDLSLLRDRLTGVAHQLFRVEKLS
ncbi:TatD family hydrolase [Porphyromonas endodontalis]|uniref:TatD family hydrolase n=1 Tax=Porphyromonas endodontalis TaxID=28124 RepID=UPI0028894225|nr:TatD family hydrolase [Porphyromonas endodontalis]